MANTQAQGKIVQCIGAVVDVEFPRDRMPRVYDALKLEGTELTLEVLQTLYRCEKKLGTGGQRDAREAMQRMDRLYERLCRIDILSALALEGKK